MACVGCNCYFSFWAIFSSFTPLTAPKNRNLNKMKKKTPADITILHKCTKNHYHMLYCSWDIWCMISFYTCVPKTMIRWCMVPEISCTTDRRSEKVGTECNSLWDEKRKKNCKPNSLIQTLIYRSNIYYSKIYQREDWKNNSSTLHLEVWTRYFRHRYSINSLELQWI